MKKFLAMLAVICSLGLAVATPAATSVYAKRIDGGTTEKIDVGDSNFEYDSSYDPDGKILDPDVKSIFFRTIDGETEAEARARIIVETLALIVGAVSLVMIIWGGIMYICSNGNPDKARISKRIITGAITGLVISILTSVILNTVVTIAKGESL